LHPLGDCLLDVAAEVMPSKQMNSFTGTEQHKRKRKERGKRKALSAIPTTSFVAHKS